MEKDWALRGRTARRAAQVVKADRRMKVSFGFRLREEIRRDGRGGSLFFARAKIGGRASRGAAGFGG